MLNKYTISFIFACGALICFLFVGHMPIDFLKDNPVDPEASIMEATLPNLSQINNTFSKEQTLSNTESPAPKTLFEAIKTKASPEQIAEYLEFRAYADEIWNTTDAESINLNECALFTAEIWEYYTTTQMFKTRGHHLCYKCPAYKEYSGLSNDLLKSLAHNGDVEAIYVYGNKLLAQQETLEDGISWLNESIARGSTRAITDIYSRLYNLARNGINLTETERQALFYRSDIYGALREYRVGRTFGLEAIEDLDNHPKAQSFLQKLQQLKTRRQELGLPDFHNVNPNVIPNAILKRCTDLENERLELEFLSSELSNLYDSN